MGSSFRGGRRREAAGRGDAAGCASTSSHHFQQMKRSFAQYRRGTHASLSESTFQLTKLLVETTATARRPADRDAKVQRHVPTPESCPYRPAALGRGAHPRGGHHADRLQRRRNRRPERFRRRRARGWCPPHRLLAVLDADPRLHRPGRRPHPRRRGVRRHGHHGRRQGRPLDPAAADPAVGPARPGRRHLGHPAGRRRDRVGDRGRPREGDRGRRLGRPRGLRHGGGCCRHLVQQRRQRRLRHADRRTDAPSASPSASTARPRSSSCRARAAPRAPPRSTTRSRPPSPTARPTPSS